MKKRIRISELDGKLVNSYKIGKKLFLEEQRTGDLYKVVAENRALPISDQTQEIRYGCLMKAEGKSLFSVSYWNGSVVHIVRSPQRHSLYLERV